MSEADGEQAVISLNGVTLVRRTHEEYAHDLKASVFAFVKGRYRKAPVKTVLDDVELAIPAGAKVGIIGSNGAGKSTLLKVIAGILHPTAGSVRTVGRVAPLLELGAGFEPDLSVTENIVSYGVLLGGSRAETARKLESILTFAELADFRNYPVRALSSGMLARLGFAIATDVDPDVVILDEILAVGDELFRKKSRRRIQGFLARGITTLIVSHDMQTIRDTCDRAIWIDRGRVRLAGEVEATIGAYLGSIDEVALRMVRARYAAQPNGVASVAD
jgi:ABC-type polysaccharide/polyol phosphate transport system ATPase subunit